MVLSNAYKKFRWGKRAAQSPLAEMYQSDFHPATSLFPDISWLVVDCEMTGLNVKTDTLLSIGWVQVNQGKIDVASGRHALCHSEGDVGDSVTIHGLSDRSVAGAGSVSRALSQFSKAAVGRVLVFHHAYLDIAFMQKAAQESFGCPMIFPYVDTMMIEKRRLDREGRAGALQLELCRDRYSLPPAFAHNALSDALATAELFLAQISSLGAEKTSLGNLKPAWA